MSDGTHAALARLESALGSYQESFRFQEAEQSALRCIHGIIEDNRRVIGALKSDFVAQEEELEAATAENDRLRAAVSGLEARVARMSDELRAARRELAAASEDRDAKAEMLSASVREARALREACDGEVRRVRSEAAATVKKATAAAAECERKCALSEKISHESTLSLRSCIHASSAIAERFHLLCRAQIEMTAASPSSGAGRPARIAEKKKKAKTRTPAKSPAAAGRRADCATAARSGARRARLAESTNVIADAVGLTSSGRAVRCDAGPGGTLYRRYSEAADTVARALNEELMEMELAAEKVAASSRRACPGPLRRIVDR